MIAFWIAAAALSATAAGLMLARAARASAPAEDPVLAVHRRQLAEIDDLAARGLLPEAEHKTARAEAGRRLLAVADQEEGEAVGAGRKVAFIAASATPLLAMGLYFLVGQPGMADAPYTERVAQWREAGPALLDAPRVAAVLKTIVTERPGDPAPLRDLGMAQLASGDTMGAVVTLRRAVAAAPQRADLWAMLGEAFVAQAGGEVGADARLAFTEALKRDPASPAALHYLKESPR